MEESSLFNDGQIQFLKRNKNEILRKIIEGIGYTHGFFSFSFDENEIYCVYLQDKMNFLINDFRNYIYVLLTIEKDMKYEDCVKYYLSIKNHQQSKDFLKELKEAIVSQLNLIILQKDEESQLLDESIDLYKE